MTAIASWIDSDNTVWVGSDSGGSDDSSIFVRSDDKVFQVGPFLIGGSGSFRCLQLLKYGGISPNLKLSKLKPPKRASNLHSFMVTKFIPMIRAIFKEGGFASAQNESEYFEGDFIVGVNGCIFGIDSDYQVGIYDKYFALGSGDNLCLGALYCLDMEEKENEVEIKTGEEIVELALSAAAEFSQSVKGPYKILSI